MSEPTPPGVPQDPSASTPPVAPPSAPAPPPPPPGGGYAGPPVSGNVAPTGYANSDEKTWALIAHFGGILVGFLAPLVAMLVKGNESPTVRAHSVEALNFQITVAIAYVVSIILSCTVILAFLPFVVWIAATIFAVLAGMKANEGVLYRYPATLRLVK
ncbi:DUF4870 domain-containing protein [Catelliglobosispora koreensis]|uniref:DUF4870 domain-containing protein n=1 Tax=Catelliglobosispora koreensis TaxID=129052 RepID=UPI00035D9789|nr:DUF4870 domain-containing protein [Catelliglobosispora koreensis]